MCADLISFSKVPLKRRMGSNTRTQRHYIAAILLVEVSLRYRSKLKGTLYELSMYYFKTKASDFRVLQGKKHLIWTKENKMNLVFAWNWEVIMPQNFCQDMQKSTISSLAKAGLVRFFIPLFPTPNHSTKLTTQSAKPFMTLGYRHITESIKKPQWVP